MIYSFWTKEKIAAVLQAIWSLASWTNPIWLASRRENHRGEKGRIMKIKGREIRNQPAWQPSDPWIRFKFHCALWEVEMSSPYLLAKELRQTLTNISYTHMYTGDLKWFESISGSQMFTKSLCGLFSNYALSVFMWLDDRRDWHCNAKFAQPRTVELVPLSASRVVCLFGETMGGQLGGFRHRDFCFFPATPAVQKCLISWSPYECSPRPCGGGSSLGRCEPSWKISLWSDLACCKHVTARNVTVWGGYLMSDPPFFPSPQKNLWTLDNIGISWDAPPSNSGISAGLVQDPWLKM